MPERCKNNQRCGQPAFIPGEGEPAEELAEILPSHVAEAAEPSLTFMDLQIGKPQLPMAGKGVTTSWCQVQEVDTGPVVPGWIFSFQQVQDAALQLLVV